MRRGGYLSLGIKDIFTPKGRIDRMTYFIYGVILVIMAVVIRGVLFGVAAGLGDAVEPYVSDYPDLIGAILVLPLLYGQFCIFAKRLHDLNLPAVLALLLFSDLIFEIAVGFLPDPAPPNVTLETLAAVGGGLGIATYVGHLLLLFVPGQRGPNRYGESSVGPDRPKPKILEG